MLVPFGQQSHERIKGQSAQGRLALSPTDKMLSYIPAIFLIMFQYDP